MAPPRKGGAAASEQAKERLTAVVMADSFTQVGGYLTSRKRKTISIATSSTFPKKISVQTTKFIPSFITYPHLPRKHYMHQFKPPSLGFFIDLTLLFPSLQTHCRNSAPSRLSIPKSCTLSSMSPCSTTS